MIVLWNSEKTTGMVNLHQKAPHSWEALERSGSRSTSGTWSAVEDSSVSWNRPSCFSFAIRPMNIGRWDARGLQSVFRKPGAKGETYYDPGAKHPLMSTGAVLLALSVRTASRCGVIPRCLPGRFWAGTLKTAGGLLFLRTMPARWRRWQPRLARPLWSFNNGPAFAPLR